MSGELGVSGPKPEVSGFACTECPGIRLEYPRTPKIWPLGSQLIPLHLLILDPYMYYISSLFYHSFDPYMAYLLIKHHCTRVETVTSDEEEREHESKTVEDNAPVETQGRHLSISYPIFWINEVI